jgi:hypothetical protein
MALDLISTVTAEGEDGFVMTVAVVVLVVPNSRRNHNTSIKMEHFMRDQMDIAVDSILSADVKEGRERSVTIPLMRMEEWEGGCREREKSKIEEIIQEVIKEEVE